MFENGWRLGATDGYKQSIRGRMKGGGHKGQGRAHEAGWLNASEAAPQQHATAANRALQARPAAGLSKCGAQLAAGCCRLACSENC